MPDRPQKISSFRNQIPGELFRLYSALRRVVVSDFGSLRGDILSEALSARESPAAKIPFLAAD